jgi:hypothetical protein
MAHVAFSEENEDQLIRSLTTFNLMFSAVLQKGPENWELERFLEMEMM